MKSLTAKFHIAFGEAFLVVSLVLTAIYLGLVPDHLKIIRDGRAALGEAIAVNSSILISDKDIRRLRTDLELVVERNEDILSAAVRRHDGNSLVMIGDHDVHWQKLSDEYSTDSQLQIPIWAGSNEWGHIELKYRPLSQSGWKGFIFNLNTQLIAFIALSSFITFYLYLSKMLRHLDPSRAVPDRVRSALDTLAEGLLVVDKNQYIVLANEAFASVVGVEPEELVGRKATEFDWSNENDQSGQLASYPWRQALEQGQNLRNQMIYLIDSHGKRRKFIVNCSLVLGDGNSSGGILVSFQDVTQLEEKEIELRKSKNLAEAANHAKSEFLANMSHEIRTPMNAILGFTDVLRRGYGDSKKDGKKYLETIHSSGKHLLELINDILDLSKVEAGQLEIERVDCAVHEVISDVMQVLTVRAKEKGISLDFVIDGSIPQVIQSDPSRLRQIITNLTGNAIKFTEQGGVKVVLKMEQRDGNASIVIDIIDSGIGMEQEHLGKIFDPFVQADSSVTRKFGGTGLGLAISRKFAKALGGKITVSSEMGKGSVFSVQIDAGSLNGVRFINAAEALSQSKYQETGPEIHWQFPNSNVLVVDDGVENRDLVKLVLEEIGLNVETAENGKVGLDKAVENHFDVILMDIQMPVMDGFTAVKAMREHGLEKPIIALTAHAMKGYEQQSLEAGYSGYLSKPIDIDKLISVLAKVLGARHVDNPRIEDSQPEKATDSSVNTNIKPLSTEKTNVAQHSVHNQKSSVTPVTSKWHHDPRFASIIVKFVDRFNDQFTAINEAWKNRDYDELENLAHWLKGAGGTVGFDIFTEPAAKLEQFAKSKNEDQIEQYIHEIDAIGANIATPDASLPTTPLLTNSSVG